MLADLNNMLVKERELANEELHKINQSEPIVHVLSNGLVQCWAPNGTNIYLNKSILNALYNLADECEKHMIYNWVIPWSDDLYVQTISPLTLGTEPKIFKKYEIDGQLPDVNPKIAELIESRVKKA